jgi:RimJ/RimL family protein N-acetyltransferase
MNIKLESERLLFRPFELYDAEALYNMDNNPNVHKYLWQKPTLELDESIQTIKYLQKQYNENGIGRFSTILKETNELIGWTGIKFVKDRKSVV